VLGWWRHLPWFRAKNYSDIIPAYAGILRTPLAASELSDPWLDVSTPRGFASRDRNTRMRNERKHGEKEMISAPAGLPAARYPAALAAAVPAGAAAPRERHLLSEAVRWQGS